MIDINTKFTPFRLKLSRREPVQLFVELHNAGNADEIVTMEVYLSSQLSFDKSGFRTADTQAIKPLKAGERKHFYYDIWPKASARIEEQPVQIKVLQHYKDMNHVLKKTERDLGLIVEE